MQDHQVVSGDKWLDARKELLAKEKEFTRLRDQLSQARRALPWERVDKEYIFHGPNGNETLAASRLRARRQSTDLSPCFGSTATVARASRSTTT